MTRAKKVSPPVAVTRSAYSGLLLDPRRIRAERDVASGADLDRKNALLAAIDAELDKLERVIAKAERAQINADRFRAGAATLR